MSREDNLLKKTGNNNPSHLNLTWSNEQGAFRCYDKITKITTLYPAPLKFLILANYIRISGWDKVANTPINSNEVLNTSKEPFIVRTKEAIKATGLYSQIKEELKTIGAKYSESIYAMLPDGQIANITLQGSNCALWMAFRNEVGNSLTKKWIEIGNPTAKQKGSIRWQEPTIKQGAEVSPQEDKEAERLYDLIDVWKNGGTTTEAIAAHDAEEDEELEIFEDYDKVAVKAEVKADIDSLPF
jgi:hypothetical protein